MSVTRRFFGRGLAASFAAGLITISPHRGRAAALPTPSGKPILKISGAIGVHNVGQEAVFDRPMLEALGWSSFRTRTPWYDNPVMFEGVLMTTVLRTVAASGQSLVVTALNDYTTQIPISDFSRYGVLLALKRDGKYMPVSDKGPLFIVYPYDSDPELQRQTYYSRSAWQVAEMQVV
jgi:hypothetical protein